MPLKPPTFRPPGWMAAPNKRPEAHDPYYGTQAWNEHGPKFSSGMAIAVRQAIAARRCEVPVAG